MFAVYEENLRIGGDCAELSLDIACARDVHDLGKKLRQFFMKTNDGPLTAYQENLIRAYIYFEDVRYTSSRLDLMHRTSNLY